MNANRGHILIVDDEPVVSELIKDDLSEHGFLCWTATDSTRARELIDDAGSNMRPLDLLIADIQMPQLGGLELLAYVRKHFPECKVVMITGHSQRQHLSQALLLGAYDYIEKPFKNGELADLAAMALSGEAEGPLLHDRAAAAMELSSQAKRASLDSVTALVRAVEAKDPYTRRHSEQVAHYAVHIAAAMGLSEPALESLRIAALLHDIGKIGVPDRILVKPGPLTDEEFLYIRRHPALGSDILASITLFGQEAKLVRYHHERWDGKGYPEGLTGEESPLASRIIQVADCIDAMLMDRTYKRGYSIEKMLEELTHSAGIQFDPKIALVAQSWCQGHREALFLPGQTALARQEVA
jgi:putative two-component system response regulator